jgi:hypothetical protein
MSGYSFKVARIHTMKFNVAVLAVLAATLAGAPLVVSAADSGSATTEAAAPAKAKHHANHHAKKSRKSKSSSSESAPK